MTSDPNAASKASEQVIAALLLVIGGLGVFAGLMSPSGGVELTIGLLMIALAVATKVRSVLRRS